MTVFATDIVAKFAVDAKKDYVTAFKDEGGLIGAAQINTPLRLAHFMAQTLHETGALTVKVESGRYTAKNLGRMWDGGNWHRYFENRAACVAMADQCAIDNGVALFSLVYGSRMGNGPPPSRDGWTYRGRGILQTTGRESYTRFGKRCGVDFAADPDLVASAAHALKPALAEWSDKNCNAAADHNDIELVTRLINGGVVGLDARKAWFAKIWPFVIGAPQVKTSTAWKVQAALGKLGYDVGAPDGVVGARTRAAILAYRAKLGLPLNPAIQDDLLAALGIV
jgi:putative chitinase